MWRTIVLVLLLLVRAAPALAHAAPLMMEPRGGATVAAPEAVRLEFSQPVELRFSRVEVRSGRTLIASGPVLEGNRLLVLSLPHLAAGRYDVKWRVLSTDGHVTEGSYWFIVSSDGAAVAVAPGPEAESGADWGLYALALLAASPLAFVLLTMRGAVRW